MSFGFKMQKVNDNQIWYCLQVLHHACTHVLNEKAVKTVVSCYVE